jgi:hypothetical protein
MGEERVIYRVLVKKRKGNGYLEDPGVDGTSESGMGRRYGLERSDSG